MAESFLVVIVDTRHPAAALEYKFRTIVRRAEALKRKGKLPSWGIQRAHRDLQYLKDHFRVWDLDKANKSPAEIARTIFPDEYASGRAGQGRAHTKVGQYRRRVAGWIALEWRVKSKGSPLA